MKHRVFTTAALLSAVALAPLSNAEDKSDDKRPAVFRCVLDKHARVIVCRLSPNLWAAYDAATCGLFKVWTGDINLTGSVYDTKHGPQPQSQGAVLFTASGKPVWSVKKGDADVDAKPRYAGYTLKNNVPTFRYELKIDASPPIVVTETPTADAAGNLQRDVAWTAVPTDVSVTLGLDGSNTKVNGSSEALHLEGEGKAVLTSAVSAKKE